MRVQNREALAMVFTVASRLTVSCDDYLHIEDQVLSEQSE
jgi:hypothetical protein